MSTRLNYRGPLNTRLRSGGWQRAPPGCWAGDFDAVEEKQPIDETLNPECGVEVVKDVAHVPAYIAPRKTFFGYRPPMSEIAPGAFEQVVKNVTSGLVNGAMESVVCVTFAGMIFNTLDPNLERLLPVGAPLILWSTSVALVWNGMFGRLPYSLCTSARGISTVVLARETVSISSRLKDTPDKVAPTVLAYLSLTTIVLGLVCFACGKLNLGRVLIQFPPPVTAGFLGSVGVLAVRGALQMASGVPFYSWPEGAVFPALMWPSDWSAFFAKDAIGQVVAMLLMVQFVRKTPPICKKFVGVRFLAPLWDFLCLLTTLAVFYSIVHYYGIGMDRLRSTSPRWVLFGGGSDIGLKAVWSYDIGQVDTDTIKLHFGSTLAVALLSLLSLVLDLSAMQHEDSDEQSVSTTEIDHELSAQGVVNILLGCSGGHIAYSNCPGTFTNRAMGGSHRLSSFVAAVVVALVYLSGSPVTTFIPNFFAGGVLMILGISYLETIETTRKQLPKKEFLVTAAVVVLALFSIELAILLGLAVVMAQFLINAATVSPVRDVRNGSSRFSCRRRPCWERRVLAEHGTRIVIVELEGFLFFGTALQLSDRLLSILNQSEIDFLLLDLCRVTQFDSTAAEALERLRLTAEDSRCQLCCCGLDKSFEALLSKSPDAATWLFDDLGRAHAECEDKVLHKFHYSKIKDSIVQPFASQVEYHNALATGSEMRDEVLSVALDTTTGLIQQLRKWSDPVAVECGGVLFDIGQQSNSLYLLTRGTVDLRVPKTGGEKQGIALVSRLAAGSLVGGADFLCGGRHSSSAIVSSPNGATFCVLTTHTWQCIRDEDMTFRLGLMEIVLRHLSAAPGGPGAPDVLSIPENVLVETRRAVAANPLMDAVISPGSNGVSQCVHVWNEWDPLEEVFVGIADNSSVPPLEEAHHAKVWDKPGVIEAAGSLRSLESVAKANRQLDNLAKVLEAKGVTVRRPAALPNRPVETYDWRCELMNGWTCPRDTILAIGSVIVEAPMSWRSRIDESLAWRDTIRGYFRRDSTCKWIAAPRPQLPDRLYRPLRSVSEAERRQLSKERIYVTQDDVEPVFDAADVLKFGKDLFVLHGNTTNTAGINWLRSILCPLGLRIHVLNFPNVPNPSHLDGYLMPLRPGFLLAHPLVTKGSELDVFRRNGWEVVEAAAPVGPILSPLAKSSAWIHLNVLSLDPKTVVVDEAEYGLHAQLEGLGFDVLKVPFRDVIEFGGGVHCCTLDVRRTSSRRQDFFPEFGGESEKKN
eukprot:Hpha_TRINITY_DN15254_c4_g5::TRINITY_DN15254_c4_g5_i1::g.65905::m.65905/K00613/GATM; glycine amidinotransferase